jgi:glycosyltransferase involved in cell wall biosynthesis
MLLLYSFSLKIAKLEEKYKSKAAEAGLQDKIIFAEPVADDDLSKYYNLADIVILPSIDRSEAFGITLIEALACAKPVIASNLPGVREVVKNGENGLVFEVKNEGDLANRINVLLNDSGLMNKMGENGRINAEKYYDHGTITKKLEAVYQKIAVK